MLGALQSAFWEPAFLRQGGDALRTCQVWKTATRPGQFDAITMSEYTVNLNGLTTDILYGSVTPCAPARPNMWIFYQRSDIIWNSIVKRLWTTEAPTHNTQQCLSINDRKFTLLALWTRAPEPRIQVRLVWIQTRWRGFAWALSLSREHCRCRPHGTLIIFPVLQMRETPQYSAWFRV